jgi:F-type H+-transporting ATPase subunit delta
MINTKVAHRYAKSLLDLAAERKITDKVYEDMTLVADVITQNHNLSVMLHSPVIKTDKKETILKKIFEGKVEQVTTAFLAIITRKRREKYLQQIAAEFISIYKQSKGISIAYITTAAPIDDKLRKEILSLMKNQGGQVELVEQVKKDLIGGFILRFGDEQIDASVVRQLKTMRRELKSN